jgi:uncharacterized protein (DUF697 family)
MQRNRWRRMDTNPRRKIKNKGGKVKEPKKTEATGLKKEEKDTTATEVEEDSTIGNETDRKEADEMTKEGEVKEMENEKKQEEEETMETGATIPRYQRANGIVKNRVMVSAGAGLIPVPLIDIAALTGIQLDMLRVLAKLYEVPFRRDIGKSIIASLVGGVGAVAMTPTFSSLIKAIPLIGQTTGAVTMSLVGGATTYAIGKVFIQHFEAGGTLLNFNPEKVKGYFAEQYKKGEKIVSEVKG